MDSVNENPLLTVIVPITRMHRKMQNLFSWLDQVDQYKCEVVLIHDKQEQETSDELQRYLQKLNSQNIQFFEGNFGSPGLARNFGKLYASGTYIMFCDSDDVLQLSSIIEIIIANLDPMVIIGGYESVNSFSKQKVMKHLAPVNLFQLAKSPGMWRFIFKSEVIKNVNFTEYCMGEDQLFLAQVDLFSKDVLRVNETLYHYYTNNPSQLTAQKDRIADLIPVVSRMIELEMQTHGQNSTFVKILILKNCLTVFKYSGDLKVDFKGKVLVNLSRQFIKVILTLNWSRALKFGSRID